MYIKYEYLLKKKITIDVTINDIVESVKANIMEKEQIPLHNPKLVFNMRGLINGMTLAVYHITNELIVELS
jgi:Ubiquitin family